MKTPTHLVVVGMTSALAIVSPPPVQAEQVLEHLGSFRAKLTTIDHLVGLETVLENYALVSSFDGLALLDLEALVQGAPLIEVDRISGFVAYSSVTTPAGDIFISLKRDGMRVAHLDADQLTLTDVAQISEPGVFYDKLTLVDDLLYVPAHANGIRIYDITTPATPVLVGALYDGFTDAFAIAVEGTTAWVADGAGGVRVVDVSDPAHPTLSDSKVTNSLPGTAEDVVFADGVLYVALGHAGVGAFAGANLADGTIYPTRTCAKQLAVVGPNLAVADIGGLELFRRVADGSLEYTAGETGSRRHIEGTPLNIRLWHGVAAWGERHVVAANWDWVDVYTPVAVESSLTADISASTQRLRLPAAGGTEYITLRNDGGLPLVIEGITVSSDSLIVTPQQTIVAPGHSIEVEFAYDGERALSTDVLIQTNDPDESPFPIQVFGRTAFLDPGEVAPIFSLETWRKSPHTSGYEYEMFDLEELQGRLVYLQMFASW